MEWISVKDRLPEKEKEVLVYWTNTSQCKRHYEIIYYTGDHWFCLDDKVRPWIKVTHWMPLPEPPEVENE